MNKQILRNKYKEIRKNINDKKELDDKIFNKVISLKEYKESNLFLTYVSLKDEVDTFKLIEYGLKIGKKVAVPKCEQDIIKFYYITSLNDLKEGKFNILEPITNNLVTNFKNSICIVPGVAFDKQNNRIGYGKGFYDKFLQNYNGIKIGLVYSKCICEEIDIEKKDIKMDKIVCDYEEFSRDCPEFSKGKF